MPSWWTGVCGGVHVSRTGRVVQSGCLNGHLWCTHTCSRVRLQCTCSWQHTGVSQLGKKCGSYLRESGSKGWAACGAGCCVWGAGQEVWVVLLYGSGLGNRNGAFSWSPTPLASSLWHLLDYGCPAPGISLAEPLPKARSLAGTALPSPQTLE